MLHEKCEDESQETVANSQETTPGRKCHPAGYLRSWVLIEVPAFLYFLSMNTSRPVVQFYLYNLFSTQVGWPADDEFNYCTNETTGNSSTHAQLVHNQVQGETNNYIMYMNLVSNLSAIAPTLLLGVLTDTFGRKFVIYVSCLGQLVYQSLTVAVLYWNLSPRFLLLSSLLQGLGGSSPLLMVAVFGLISDFTTPGHQRTTRITTTEASIHIAISVATMTSGIWVKTVGYFGPILFAAGCNVLSLAFVTAFIPTDIVHRSSQQFNCKDFVKFVHLYIMDTPTRRRCTLIVCTVSFLVMVAVIAEMNISIIYLLHEPFCWSETWITLFLGVVTLVKWISVVSFTHLGRNWISEPVFVLVGTLSSTIGLLCKGVARSDTLIYVGAVLSILSETVFPMTRTIMSKTVSASEQGTLLAGLGVLQTVMTTAASIVVSSLYGVGLHTYLGLPYIVLASLQLMTVFLLVSLLIKIKHHPEMDELQLHKSYTEIMD